MDNPRSAGRIARGISSAWSGTHWEADSTSFNRITQESALGIGNNEENHISSIKSHPKAVSSLLRFIRSEKDKYYKDTSEGGNDLEMFTDHHESEGDLRRSDFIDELNKSSVSKRRRGGVGEDFCCSLCNVSCTSQIVLDAHLAGRKHVKKLQKFKSEAIQSKGMAAQFARKPADIQNKFDQLSIREPLVGIEYVTEYQRLGSAHRYYCELCELKSNSEQMLRHVTSRKHRLRFVRTHRFDVYCEITDYPNFLHIMRPSEADELLRRHSLLMVSKMPNGKPRLCKVRPNTGEDNMTIDVLEYQQMCEVHPSQHDDLLTAEMLLRQEESEEKIQKTKKWIKLETENKQEIERRGRNNKILERRQESSASSSQAFLDVYQEDQEYGLGSCPADDLLGISEEDILLADLLTSKSLESDLIESTLRAEHVRKLEEQELRIIKALGKLDESSGGGSEMTAEELVAEDKLTTLLVSIRTEKRRNLLLKTIHDSDLVLNISHANARNLLSAQSQSVPMGRVREIESNGRLRRPRRRRAIPPPPPTAVKRPLPRTHDKQPSQAINKPNTSAFHAEVEPIIEKTRQQVEQKILEALNSGSLSALTEAFKNNPDLQASLKQWERQQEGKLTSKPTDSNPTSQSDHSNLSNKQPSKPVKLYPRGPHSSLAPTKLSNYRRSDKDFSEAYLGGQFHEPGESPPRPLMDIKITGHPHFKTNKRNHIGIETKRALLHKPPNNRNLQESSFADIPSTSYNPRSSNVTGFGDSSAYYNTGNDCFTEPQHKRKTSGLLGSRPQFVGQSGKFNFLPFSKHAGQH